MSIYDFSESYVPNSSQSTTRMKVAYFNDSNYYILGKSYFIINMVHCVELYNCQATCLWQYGKILWEKAGGG